MSSEPSIMQRLHDSEINCSVSCFFDGEWEVKLGDEMNGFDKEATVMSFDEALAWLDREARIRYPRSGYATGVYPEGHRSHVAPPTEWKQVNALLAEDP